jgi:fused signal recognition particle receptor
VSSAAPKKTSLFGKLFSGKEAAPETVDEPAEIESTSATDAATPLKEQANSVFEDAARPGDETDSGRPHDLAGVKTSGWFGKLTSGLRKTSSKLTAGISDLLTKSKLDAGTLDDLEDLLIQADLGVETSMKITEAIGSARFDSAVTDGDVRKIVAQEVTRVLEPVAKPLVINPANKPHVILVVGVNGSGKTTTIGKLAAQLKSSGKSLLIAAGDTFRAAAIDQLKVWGERTQVAVISRAVGSDASGLVFDAMDQAKRDGTDVLLIDTAGRLQNKRELMDELEKVIRVIKKGDSAAPHDVVLVLDATTGQNALSQVDVFQSSAGVTGLVMTKLDGTARGGILVAIAAKYGLPVHAIGVGEGVEDLQSFNASEFASAMTEQ